MKLSLKKIVFYNLIGFLILCFIVIFGYLLTKGLTVGSESTALLDDQAYSQQDDLSTEAETTLTLTPSVSPTITGVKQNPNGPALQVTVSPSPAPTLSLSPSPKPVAASNTCIVTIQGQKYDVTSFRKVHSGGNIFVCGTDMTNTFFSQHNQRTLTQMSKYKV